MTISNIRKIIEESQNCSSHAKLCRQLISVYQKMDYEEFLKEFILCMKKVLIHGTKQPTVERALNFIAKFATTSKSTDNLQKEIKNFDENGEEEEEIDDVDPFLIRIFLFLLNNHEANSKAVRFRICQMINKLLNSMGEKACIDDELYSTIYDTMMDRLVDKVPAVRIQAVLALSRLQDPRNKECPIIKAYRYHLSVDPNSDVRRAVLTNIAITFQTLPDILDRTRDVVHMVRRQAYLCIASKVHIRSLTIAQRIRLISEGLNDRSDIVRLAVERNLIQSWLRILNGSIVDFLTCIDVEASTKGAEMALNAIFKHVSPADVVQQFTLLNDSKVFDIDKLQPESALYWRCLSEYLRMEGSEEILEKVLPDLTYFCKYIKEYVALEVQQSDDLQETAFRHIEKDFVVCQLVTMTTLFDFTDEVGRKTLDKIILYMLLNGNTSEAVTKKLVESYARLHPPVIRVNQLAEIISEIREPEVKTTFIPLSDEEQRKNKMQIAKIDVQLHEVNIDLEDCVRTLDLEKAQSLKEKLEKLQDDRLSLNQVEVKINNEIEEVKDDPETLTKCLSVVTHMLTNSDIATMTPALHSLHENLVLQSLKSQDPAVRNQAVHSLGLLCLLSLDLAKQHLLLFVQISQMDVEDIQISSLKSIFDFLMFYGIEEFKSVIEGIAMLPGCDQIVNTTWSKEGENTEEHNYLMVLLFNMLDCKSSVICTVVAEGLCKLLLSSRLSSVKLLSHLILMWYNPNTEDNHMLRHMLGVFFPLYVSRGSSNQETICSCVIPVLKTLFNAPIRSPLTEVDIEDVYNFLLSVSSPLVVTDKSESLNPHDTLVFRICSEILAYPDSYNNKTLIRCLNKLNLTPSNFVTLKQVQSLSQKLCQKVKDRSCLSGLEKFHQSIKSFLKLCPEDDKDEEDKSKCLESSNSIQTSNRKKRTLYSSQSDTEMLMSEADSESEKSPFNKKSSESIIVSSKNCLLLDSTLKSSSSLQPNTTSDDEMQSDCSKLGNSLETMVASNSELQLVPLTKVDDSALSSKMEDSSIVLENAEIDQQQNNKAFTSTSPSIESCTTNSDRSVVTRSSKKDRNCNTPEKAVIQKTRIRNYKNLKDSSMSTDSESEASFRVTRSRRSK